MPIPSTGSTFKSWTRKKMLSFILTQHYTFFTYKLNVSVSQALLSDPVKMKEATDKYNAMMKAQQEAAAKAQGTGSSVPTSAAAAGSEGNDAVGGKDATGTKDVGLDDDGEPLGPEAEGLEVPVP